ncbi:hypothetical protein CJD36_003770 [Flavipsychrobacter stenotrophus]|uniref:Uncharacterized protein n=1 Tax=Flavipsychrobacter stenotrophus TaxID=2077091 RepID=A0A2S7T0Y7_9BACT|nr:hypothetical protein [Flavipsychrobacter stenotrophus]PQJ12873.1 hypothetical protein CJD36_003770 [Flavipsychrobacter stenotrophus]
MNKRAVWILLLLTALVAGVLMYMQHTVHTALGTLNNAVDSSNHSIDSANRHTLDSLNRAHDDIEMKRTELQQRMENDRKDTVNKKP